MRKFTSIFLACILISTTFLNFPGRVKWNVLIRINGYVVSKLLFLGRWECWLLCVLWWYSWSASGLCASRRISRSLFLSSVWSFHLLPNLCRSAGCFHPWTLNDSQQCSRTAERVTWLNSGCSYYYIWSFRRSFLSENRKSTSCLSCLNNTISSFKGCDWSGLLFWVVSYCLCVQLVQSQMCFNTL